MSLGRIKIALRIGNAKKIAPDADHVFGGLNRSAAAYIRNALRLFGVEVKNETGGYEHANKTENASHRDSSNLHSISREVGPQVTGVQELRGSGCERCIYAVLPCLTVYISSICG